MSPESKTSLGDFFTGKLPFFGYLREYKIGRWRLALSIFLAAVKHSPVIILPIYTSYVIDNIIPAEDLTGLLLCVIGMVSLIIINISVHPLYVHYYSQVRREVALRLRARLCHRIQQLVFAWHDSNRSGRLHSKVMQDVEKLDRIGQVLVDPLLVTLMTVVTALTIILIKEPLFGLLLGIFIPLIIILHRSHRGKLRKKHRELRLELEKLNAEVDEMLTMLPVSRAHATEAQDLHRIDGRLNRLRDTAIGTDFFTNILTSQIWGSSQLVTISVVCFGALLVIHGQMTLGEVVMFLSFVGMTIGGLSGILSQLVAFYEGNEAMKSINEVLVGPPVEENEGKPEIGPIRGEIEMRNLWFAYSNSERPVLRSIDITIQPNQTIALVGASGAGKSTFIKLILGFYKPLEGEILIDGRAMSDIDLRSFRRQVGIVTQDTFLFNGTIGENLTHGLDSITREDMEEAARVANAHQFISELPEGYGAEIGDRGTKLSGGQKQRIAIARALLRKPRLLILDEATSALDSESEQLVQEALEKLMEGRTAFVIAHRLSTIRDADRILVFDEGRIVEEGTHDVLVQKDGIYARLVKIQNIA